MNYTNCSNEWIRQVISGEITFRKCPACDSNGIEYQAYNEYGNSCNADDETAERHPCEKCDRIAYIQIPKYH